MKMNDVVVAVLRLCLAHTAEDACGAFGRRHKTCLFQ
jgi:hypothetical protein